MAVRVRDDLLNLKPYDPDMRDVEVMLSANENAYGLPKEVRGEMLRRMASVEAHRYPEATSRRLRALLGELWGVPARNVVVGNGGDELIFNLLLAFGGPGRTVVVCPPTFSAYELYAQLTGTQVVNVRRTNDFSLDEAAVLAAVSSADLVFLTSPNNPSGNLMRPEFARSLAASTDALIVVDEAYGEFAPASASCVSLVAEFENICVLKTLSKAYALAGARVGYVIASDEVTDALLAVRQPYSVSRFDQVAAETVVEMHGQLTPATEALVENRAVLESGLAALAAELEQRAGHAVMRVYPSQANFILVRFATEVEGVPCAHDIHETLARDHSVLVRDFSSTPGLAGCLRITVGTPAENERLLAALRSVLSIGEEA